MSENPQRIDETRRLDAELASALRARGHRVTPQRLVIHRTLRAEPAHLTAEALLERVEHALPNVSLPTVYATLELLESLELVRRVPGVGGTLVYDSRSEPHHHLVCRRCGAVSDLDSPLDDAAARRAASRRGFVTEHATLSLLGVCRACRRADAERERGAAAPPA